MHELLTDGGVAGAAVATVVGLLYALIRRGLKVKIKAEIPPRSE
jgi:hypothetical protein